MGEPRTLGWPDSSKNRELALGFFIREGYSDESSDTHKDHTSEVYGLYLRSTERDQRVRDYKLPLMALSYGYAT